MTPAVKARRLRHDGTADAVSMRALLLALFLLLGVLAGFGASLRFAPAGDDLRAYIDAQVTRGASSPLSAGTAARTLACYLRASLAAFLLGYSAVGVLALPLLLMAQGFVLSFSLFSFAEAVGRDGFALLPALFGLRLLFVVPCTFTLGVAALERSWALWSLLCGRRARPVSPGLYRFAVCCVCLLLGCVLELWLVPLFLRAAA